uniref:Uncharacterized protein n=1 Tax=Romanomermis culicivorax TaxID=13658 RepID=A0A915JFD1_ROMCU
MRKYYCNVTARAGDNRNSELKFAPGFIAFIEKKAGSMNEAQKSEWESFFERLENSLAKGGL